MKIRLPRPASSAAALAILLALISAPAPAPAAPPVPSAAPPTEKKETGEDGGALYTSALKYLQGKEVPKDEKHAYELAERAAQLGQAEAIGLIGYFYSVGLVVPKDDTIARGYFETAAAKGAAGAQLNLGIFLLKGRGGEKDPVRGLTVIERAVAQGALPARLILGDIYLHGDHAAGTPDYSKAYQVFLGAAEKGNARAQNAIGMILREGRLGTPDLDAARQWFEKAAWQGDGKACSNLGTLLGYDSQDRAVRIEALKWLTVAATLKEVTAEYLLGDISPRIPTEELTAAREQAAEATRLIAAGAPARN